QHAEQFFAMGRFWRHGSGFTRFVRAVFAWPGRPGSRFFALLQPNKRVARRSRQRTFRARFGRSARSAVARAVGRAPIARVVLPPAPPWRLPAWETHRINRVVPTRPLAR